MKNFLFSILLVLFACPAFGLTPIARNDVVPYQRIEYGGSMKIGVVAFSKAGIDDVVFEISGQGYSGGDKTATSMTLNDRTGLWEYWVTLSASEFSGNGVITVTPVVTGDDAGTKYPGAYNLYVAGGSVYTPVRAYVNGTTGSDSTGVVNNPSYKFQTVSAAVTAAAAANGGTGDGVEIICDAGTYTLSGTAPTTSSQWLKITKSDAASVESVIFNAGGGLDTTNLFRMKDVTIQYVSNYIIDQGTSSGYFVWLENVRGIGRGWEYAISSPVRPGHADYVTGDYVQGSPKKSYFYDSGQVLGNAKIVLNTEFERVSDDPAQNALFVAGCYMHNLDPYAQQPTAYPHVDAYQSWGAGPSNRILYSNKITDAHYQGFFMRAQTSAAANNAIVNNLVVMEEPGRLDTGGGTVRLTSGTMSGVWDHTYVVGNTFYYKSWVIDDDDIGFGFTNSYFVGNHFFEWKDNYYQNSSSTEAAFTQHGNSDGNVFLYNSFEHARSVDGTPCYWDFDTYPHCYSKAPDSGVSATGDTRIVGDPLFDSNYIPQASSPLVDYYSTVVPVDLDGNARGAMSTVGALEYIPGTSDTTPPVVGSKYPTSPLPAGTTSITVSHGTDEIAECKWDISDPGVGGATGYAVLTNSYAQNPSTSFSLTASGLTDGSTRTYYILCRDDEATPNYMATVETITVEVLTSSDTCETDADLCLNQSDCLTYHPTNNWYPLQDPACTDGAATTSCGPGDSIGGCLNETDCTNASLHWYEGACYEIPEPSGVSGSNLLQNPHMLNWTGSLPEYWTQGAPPYTEETPLGARMYDGGGFYQVGVCQPNTTYQITFNTTKVTSGQTEAYVYPTNYYFNGTGTHTVTVTTLNDGTSRPFFIKAHPGTNDVVVRDTILKVYDAKSFSVVPGGSLSFVAGGTLNLQ